MDEPKLTVELEQIDAFEFKVKFGGGVELVMDEPEPLGTSKGPNASKVNWSAMRKRGCVSVPRR